MQSLREGTGLLGKMNGPLREKIGDMTASDKVVWLVGRNPLEEME